MVDHTTVCIMVNYRLDTDSTWYMDSPSDFQRKTVSSKFSRWFAWRSETLLTKHCCLSSNMIHAVSTSPISIIIPYYPMSKIKKNELRIPTTNPNFQILRIPTRNIIKALPIRSPGKMLVVFDAATDQIDLWQFKICPPESTEMSRYQAHRCLSVSLRGVKLTTSRNMPSCRRAARTADLYNPATRHSARKTRSALVGPSQTYSPIWPAADQKWANLQNGEDRISPFWTATHFSHPQTFKQSKPNMTFMVTLFWRHCCCSHSKWTSSVLLMGWKAQENPVIATSSQPFISGQNPKDPAGHLVITAEPRASQVVTHFWWFLAKKMWVLGHCSGCRSRVKTQRFDFCILLPFCLVFLNHPKTPTTWSLKLQMFHHATRSMLAYWIWMFSILKIHPDWLTSTSTLPQVVILHVH